MRRTAPRKVQIDSSHFCLPGFCILIWIKPNHDLEKVPPLGVFPKCLAKFDRVRRKVDARVGREFQAYPGGRKALGNTCAEGKKSVFVFRAEIKLFEKHEPFFKVVADIQGQIELAGFLPQVVFQCRSDVKGLVHAG